MKITLLSISALIFICTACSKTPESVEVSEYTKSLIHNVSLKFDEIDKQESTRGLIAEAKSLTINDNKGKVVWDMSAYSFLKKEKPQTAHPLLWEMAQLNATPGLYQVVQGIYQIRGFDIANMAIIEGKTGWIVVDTLTTKETAMAAFDFFKKNVKKKPIVAIIFTHSHIDHFGGVLGIITENDVKNKKITVIAPKGFMEEAFSENILLANAMARRAEYQFGQDLPISPTGQIDSGIGKTAAQGSYSIVEPTVTVDTTPTKMIIDGVEFIFQYTPDTEAPAEMTFYLPAYKAFCPAEIASRTMHNLYTLRGTKIRDAYKWSKYINESLQLFPDVEVCFFTHNWPMYGNNRIREFLIKQADMYKFIHDQTIRLANKGFTPEEIAHKLTLPQSLSLFMPNRQFYGVLQQNVKAVYQMYMGWYNGNPAYLNQLPDIERAKRYVEYMGGVKSILEKAGKSYNNGDYQWVAEVLNHVVMAQPDNQEARKLLAKTYTQLAYQAESGVWRNVYLKAAQELSTGMQKKKSVMFKGYDMLKHMPPEKLFDSMAVNLNPEKAEHSSISIAIHFSDKNASYMLYIRNSVLYYSKGIIGKQEADLHIPYTTFIKLITGAIDKTKILFDKDVQWNGSNVALIKFFSMFEKQERFAIVTPR
ncbi:MAG TPA: alkyl sulfatase dimerization domain-containing protein [Spirochaetota bacterium]|nr:alkyl sulfatase dimerization domain-containing protein [Spirochaetota bacterium]